MATIPEMAEFMAGLPEDARAVIVVQRRRHPLVLRTEKLELGVEWPNWPKAVWEGMTMALSGLPDPDDGSGGENKPNGESGSEADA